MELLPLPRDFPLPLLRVILLWQRKIQGSDCMKVPAAMPGLSKPAAKIFINPLEPVFEGLVDKNFLRFPAIASSLDRPAPAPL